MLHLAQGKKFLAAHFIMIAALLALVVSLVACKSETSASKNTVQKTFVSPADAGAAILDAAKSGNRDALLVIFGPDGKEALFSGDAVKDNDALQDFVAAYAQMHRWREIKAGGQMLYIGADNFLFPIPLGQNSSGQWYFDTAAGKDEILARRVGKGELSAIAALVVLADAEAKYCSQTHDGGAVKQYSPKFVSDNGTQDGLYWEVAEGQAPSPLGQLADLAESLGYTNSGEKAQPFNGYHFRILTKQGNTAEGGEKDYIVDGKMTGGFAILAYPSEYRNSGIMTFIVGKDGVIYQKDLGEKTSELAAVLTEYNPGDGWKPAL